MRMNFWFERPRTFAVSVFFGLVLCVFSYPLFAQAPTPAALVIDHKAVIQASKAATSLQEQLDVVNDRNEEELKPQQNEVRAAGDKLKQDRAGMSAAAYDEAKAKVDGMVDAYRADVQARKSRLEGRMQRTLVEIRKSLQQITIEIASERGANLVLAKDAVVIMSSDFDITAEALRRLDERMPTVVLVE